MGIGFVGVRLSTLKASIWSMLILGGFWIVITRMNGWGGAGGSKGRGTWPHNKLGRGLIARMTTSMQNLLLCAYLPCCCFVVARSAVFVLLELLKAGLAHK